MYFYWKTERTKSYLCKSVLKGKAMLQFFRKYQKIFFVVITFVIVISFSFFGTYSHAAPEKDELEDTVVQTISGSKISLKQVKLLSFFLDHDPDDERLPNLLNDFILQSDIFETPIGSELAKQYFPFIKKDLQSTFERIKTYRSYCHPNLAFFSSEMIWDRYLPEINDTLAQLQKCERADLSYFEKLCKAYVLQKQFPPQLLKSILIQTQQQQQWIQPDPSLSQRDFHLFGFQDASDWFGKSFIDLISICILNISEIVEKNGQGATFDQAKIEMYKQFLQKAQRKARIEKNDLSKFFDLQLRHLQMTEKQVICFWQKILNVRQYIQSVQTNILLDQKMWPCMLEKATIEEYHLPKHLQFQTFTDVLKFDMYLKAVGDSTKCLSKLEIPADYLSQSYIFKHYPELVERRFTLNVKEVTQQMLKEHVSIKSLLKWELEHWDALGDQFSFINQAITTKKGRFDSLQKLTKQDRQTVDEYAKKEIILQNPNWVEDLLSTQKPVKKEIGISLDHQGDDFIGVDDYQKLKAHLLSRKDQTSTQVFSDNEKAYYAFEVLEVSKEDEIMSFERSLQTKAIDAVLNRVLQAHYKKIRAKHPVQFQDKDQKFKPYKEVVEEVGLNFFENIYSGLDKKLMKKGKNLLEFYASARLVPYLNAIKQKIQEPTTPFLKQFGLVKDHKTFTDKDKIYKSAFRLSEGSWSDVVIEAQGPAFFKLIKKEALIDQEDLKASQKALSDELLKKIIQDVIDKMKKTDLLNHV